jgi:hypothetical protein
MAEPNKSRDGCLGCGCLGLLGLDIAMLVATCSGGHGTGSSSSTATTTVATSAPANDDSHVPQIGDEYWFKIHPICLDDYKAFDTLADAEVKHDNEGVAQVLGDHGVDIGSGTHVRILNVDVFRSDVDVRVTSTDSNHYGEEIYCFIPPNDSGQPMFDNALQHI